MAAEKTSKPSDRPRFIEKSAMCIRPPSRRPVLPRSGARPCLPVPRLASALFHQAQAFDAHSPVHCLAHIVDREQCDTDGGQPFHLDTGSPDCLGTRRAFPRVASVKQLEFTIDAA